MCRFKSFLLVFVVLLVSCGDGDIITLELEFDQDLSLCGNISVDNYELVNDDYVVYDIKQDPSESVILVFPGTASNDIIFFPTESPFDKTLSVGGSTRFNYRTYKGDATDVICEVIPSSEVKILNDYEATSGTIVTSSSFIDVDGTRTVTVSFEIQNFNIEVLNSTSLSLGTYMHSYPTPQ